MKLTVIRDISALLIVFPLLFTLSTSVQFAHGQDIELNISSENYTLEELNQMLAPIALYPDTLLSQILMASTYPIEVIEAHRWIKSNPQLIGDDLDSALLDKDWDPSVKAICHFPPTLAVMSDRISETTNLGNAFLIQEAEVLAVIQQLRDKAYSLGNLRSTTEQNIIVEEQTIIIEPARPQIIYIPYYDPYYVYGSWWYPNYQPYYWGPSGARLNIGVSYWPGVSFGFAFGGWSYFDWHRHQIHINPHKRPRFVKNNWYRSSGRWQHAPKHRRGVAYRDKNTALKYGQTRHRTRGSRTESRGFRDDLQRTLQPKMIDKNKIKTPRTRLQQEQRQQIHEELKQQSREPFQQHNRIEQIKRKTNQTPVTRIQQGQQQRVREELKQQSRELFQQQNRADQNKRRVNQVPAKGMKQKQQPQVRGAQQQWRTQNDHNKPARPDLNRTQNHKQSQQQNRIDSSRRTTNPVLDTSSQRRQQPPTRSDKPRVNRQEHIQRQKGNGVFNQIGDGTVERQSSQRGRSSRQEAPNQKRK